MQIFASPFDPDQRSPRNITSRSSGPNRVVRSILCAAIAFAAATTAHSQLTSTATTVALTATLGEVLTVSATPSAVTFALVQGGTATASSAIAIHTTWLLLPTRANLYLDAYFSSAASALADTYTTPDKIPTSAVLGQVTTGSPTTYTAFTQTAALGPAGAGLTLVSLPLTLANVAGTRTDNLNLEINLSALPLLPAGTYTGTLTIQAEAL